MRLIRYRCAAPAVAFAACLCAAPPALAAGQSLLEDLLDAAPLLAISLTNLAQNIGRLDASVTVGAEQTFTAMAEFMTLWAAGRADYGSTVAAGAGAMAADLPVPAVAFAAPRIEIGQIATTGVGALQSADMMGNYDGSGIVGHVMATAGPAALLAESRGSLGAVLAMQNVALNLGEVDAGVRIALADVHIRTSDIATTAIGGLQTGALNTSVDLLATVQGSMGDLAESSAVLVRALVGQQ